MTVKALKQYLSELPPEFDEVVLLKPSGDHSYSLCRPRMEDAERVATSRAGQRPYEYYEYFDDLNMSPTGQQIKALVF